MQKQEAASSNGKGGGGTVGERGWLRLSKSRRESNWNAGSAAKLIHADVDRRYLTTAITNPTISPRCSSISVCYPKLDVIQISGCCCLGRREGEARVGGMQNSSSVSCIWFMSQSLDPSSKTPVMPHLWLHLSWFYLWARHKRFMQINITLRPSGLRHCGMLLYFNIAKQDA